MFWVSRKATGKVVGWNVPEESIDLYLSTLPTGVYALEDSDGNELNLVTVKRGRVEYARCYGPVPDKSDLPAGVEFAVASN
jgi:hypothetical protein